MIIMMMTMKEGMGQLSNVRYPGELAIVRCSSYFFHKTPIQLNNIATIQLHEPLCSRSPTFPGKHSLSEKKPVFVLHTSPLRTQKSTQLPETIATIIYIPTHKQVGEYQTRVIHLLYPLKFVICVPSPYRLQPTEYLSMLPLQQQPQAGGMKTLTQEIMRTTQIVQHPQTPQPVVMPNS